MDARSYCQTLDELVAILKPEPNEDSTYVQAVASIIEHLRL